MIGIVLTAPDLVYVKSEGMLYAVLSSISGDSLIFNLWRLGYIANAEVRRRSAC